MANENAMNNDIEKNGTVKKTLDQKIQAQQELLKKLKAQKQAQEQKAKKRQTDQERRNNTRKKILLGSFLLNKMQNDDQEKQKTLNDLNKYLVLDRDRELFELPVLIKIEANSEA